MIGCPREGELVRAVRCSSGGALPGGQQEHLRECADCREAVAVAAALVDDAAIGAGPPTAEIVWFRTQLRARAEAADLAARPVLLVEAVAGASVVGAVAAVVSVLGGFEVSALVTRGLLLAFAIWLLVVPVAVYLATTED